MPIPIVRRPGIPTSVGDHETRIRALERGGIGRYVKYDFANIGDWLYIETDGELDLSTLADPLGIVGAAGASWGFVLEEAGGFGIALASAGNIRLQGDTFNMQMVGTVAFATQLNFQFFSSSGGFVTALAGAATINADDDISLSSNGDVLLNPDNLASGTNYLKIQNLPTSNPGGTNRVWNSGGTLKIT